MFQIRIHGRGGQGVVTAAEVLSVAAFFEGREAQATAVGHGKKAARHIDAFLRNSVHSAKPRPAVAGLDRLRRTESFDETVGGLDENTALYEARRCLSCGNCFGCDNCYGLCPDNAIVKLGTAQFRVNLDYCKGCGLCAQECPCGAIEMANEPM